MNHKIEDTRRIIRKNYSLWQRIVRIVRFYIILLMRKKDTAESIAHGMGIGVFIGMIPIIPFQTVIAVLACSIFKKNKFAGVIGTNIFTNAINAPVTFYLLHFFGKPFLHTEIDYQQLKDLIVNFSFSKIAEFGIDIYLEIIIGGVIIGTVLYPVSYYLTLNTVLKFRNRRKKKEIVLGR